MITFLAFMGGLFVGAFLGVIIIALLIKRED
jgi:hypothetical protein